MEVLVMSDKWEKKGSYESTRKRFQQYDDVFKPARPKDEDNELDQQSKELEEGNEPQHIKDIFKK
jgi:hypothetical protein